MSNELDDATLTAYALGELSPDAAAAVEAQLESDPVARDTVLVIRATAADLQTALAAEPTPSLTLPQRAAVLNAASRTQAKSTFYTRRTALAAAACLAMAAATAVSVMLPSLNRARETVALNTARSGDREQAGKLDSSLPDPNDVRDMVPRTPDFANAPSFSLESSNATSKDKIRQLIPSGGQVELRSQPAATRAPNELGIGAVPILPPARSSEVQAQVSVPDDAILLFGGQTLNGRVEGAEVGGIPNTGQSAQPAAPPQTGEHAGQREATASRTPAPGGPGEQRAHRERFAGELDTKKPAFTVQQSAVVSSRVESRSAPAKAKPVTPYGLPRDAYDEIIRYPDNWADLSTARDRSVRTENAAPRSDAQVQAVLGKRLPEVRFDRVGLVDAVDFLKDVTDEEIAVDWDRLNEIGITQSTPVTARLRDVPFDKALKIILADAGQGKLAYAVDNGRIVVSIDPTAAAHFNTESYARIHDNPFLAANQNPLSTFSIDVDTASYSNVRRFLTSGQLPPADAVRVEELVNYFPYDYATPDGDAPFAANVEVAAAPWNPAHRLVRVGLRGKDASQDKAIKSMPKNLVFLIDVSGSMQAANKLPLLKESMKMLVRELNERDRVTIAVYAGSSGLVLPPTRVGEVTAITDQGPDITGRDGILNAIDRLEAGGSTNGAAGITLAYEQAASAFIKDGVNRVVLCTDGDFNVGVTSEGELTRLIEEKAKGGVFLSVLGFGMGNVKDSTMEKLADKGNGNYGYIDTLAEAKKTLVDQMNGTLVTIAKDVKIQVEFNPAKVGSYRLIGYENRLLAKEDFNDDKKDAGEIGAGHTVTALYEVVPVGVKSPATGPGVDPLKYQPVPEETARRVMNDELLTLKLRYKAPDAPLEQGTSKLLAFPVKDGGQAFAAASVDFRFASSVAAFGMILRDSAHKGDATLANVAEIAAGAKGEDKNGYRAEFVELVSKAAGLVGR
jgi:Ca-activated chloride channel family protein